MRRAGSNQRRSDRGLIGWRTATLMLSAAVAVCNAAVADEGGSSFWQPGQYASFAALASPSGWSLPFTFYSSGGAQRADRSLASDKALLPNTSSSFDALYLSPTYTGRGLILGAVPGVSLTFGPAYDSASIGDPTGRQSDRMVGVTDLDPQVQLNWIFGVHNIMSYLAANIPTGSYNPGRVVGIGIGHAAIDAGGAYTYYDTEAGLEASATFGITQNFRNPSTSYRNGLDAHLDLAASYYLTPAFFVGIAGFYYQQLTADHGQALALGPNESRTRGIGPQIGWDMNLGGRIVSATLRGYTEFGVYRRLQGHAIYAIFSIPLWTPRQKHPPSR
jgi:hypothetical protein